MLIATTHGREKGKPERLLAGLHSSKRLTYTRACIDKGVAVAPIVSPFGRGELDAGPFGRVATGALCCEGDSGILGAHLEGVEGGNGHI
eukprot:1188272-Prorocentrum_minimum.AAC.1